MVKKIGVNSSFGIENFFVGDFKLVSESFIAVRKVTSFRTEE